MAKLFGLDVVMRVERKLAEPLTIAFYFKSSVLH